MYDAGGATSRRQFLRETAAGFGWLAFAALAAQSQATEPQSRFQSPLAPKSPHFPARAKRVIFIFAGGGPSQVDTFDYKPELNRHGTSVAAHQYMGSVLPFKQYGESGLPISDAFPCLAEHADDLCLLNGMTTSNPGHQQAIVALHTGNEMFVRPSLGAWIVYGLGTEAEDLPGFVTIDPLSDQGGAMNYGSAFLPATFQGTRLSGSSRAVPYISNLHLTAGDQRRQLDFIQSANRDLLSLDPTNSELEGLIESYELAYKMQTSVPATLDLAEEPQHVRRLYGLDNPTTERFGMQCLLARRLAEKGVRFIQLTQWGWDHHYKIAEALPRTAEAVDKPIAGLLADLKARDMLRDTLVVWGGEFGRGARTDNGHGRGHNNRGFTMWMAGGGVQGGMRYGATDETGDRAVEGIMNTHDLHATILHLLGLDHEQLTYRYAGRDFRLTDTAGEVATGILTHTATAPQKS